VTKSRAGEIAKTTRENLHKEIDALTGKGPGRFTKKAAEDIKAGIADGVRGLLVSLAAEGAFTDEG
jgi:hypothetical protein